MDDLVIARRVHMPVDDMILNQLKISGSEWEHKEQERQRTEGARKYRILEAFDGDAPQSLFDKVGDMMWDERLWHVLRRKTHASQLHVFKLLAREGAACFELVRARHRWFPYRLFDVMRSDSAAVELADKKKLPDCVLDPIHRQFQDALRRLAARGGRAGRAPSCGRARRHRHGQHRAPPQREPEAEQVQGVDQPHGPYDLGLLVHRQTELQAGR